MQPLRRLTLSLSIMVLFTASGAARAQDLCAEIEQLVDQSRTQFVEITAETQDGGAREAAMKISGAASCRVMKGLNGNLYRCAWEFPHQASEAYNTFDSFVSRVGDCLGDQATQHEDKSVNHPDYFALTRYELPEAKVSVSVKDKAALGLTYVFIRVQGASQ
ncbi:MAG: hypothetical protein AAF495_13005 [Pseudomonadota bacterium]